MLLKTCLVKKLQGSEKNFHFPLHFWVKMSDNVDRNYLSVYKQVVHTDVIKV